MLRRKFFRRTTDRAPRFLEDHLALILFGRWVWIFYPHSGELFVSTDRPSSPKALIGDGHSMEPQRSGEFRRSVGTLRFLRILIKDFFGFGWRSEMVDEEEEAFEREQAQTLEDLFSNEDNWLDSGSLRPIEIQSASPSEEDTNGDYAQEGR